MISTQNPCLLNHYIVLYLKLYLCLFGKIGFCLFLIRKMLLSANVILIFKCIKEYKKLNEYTLIIFLEKKVRFYIKNCKYYGYDVKHRQSFRKEISWLKNMFYEMENWLISSEEEMLKLETSLTKINRNMLMKVERNL